MTRYFLEHSFSKEFVNSSSETMDANGFKLEVTHQGLEELVDSLISADASVQDPLSKVSPVCPREEGKAASGPSVSLQCMLASEPSVSAAALLKVYQMRKGWGINPAPAPKEVVDRPGCYVFLETGYLREGPSLSSDKLPQLPVLTPVQVLELKMFTHELHADEPTHEDDAGLVCGRIGPPYSGWVSLARPGDRLRFGWPSPLPPVPSSKIERVRQPS